MSPFSESSTDAYAGVGAFQSPPAAHPDLPCQVNGPHQCAQRVGRIQTMLQPIALSKCHCLRNGGRQRPRRRQPRGSAHDDDDDSEKYNSDGRFFHTLNVRCHQHCVHEMIENRGHISPGSSPSVPTLPMAPAAQPETGGPNEDGMICSATRTADTHDQDDRCTSRSDARDHKNNKNNCEADGKVWAGYSTNRPSPNEASDGNGCRLLPST